MPRTQSSRILAVSTDLGPDKLLLRRMSGSESLGRMFSYTLEMTSEDKEIPFESLIGKGVTVRLELLDGKTRYFNGYVSRFVQTAVGTRLAHYRATVVPWLWFLTRVSDCRIFQNKTVPEIIMEVFRSRGFADFNDSGLSGRYRTCEYCVQYRETDFNFVSRLMEQEGIYYYFKHENGKHTLMLADSSNAHSQLPGYPELRYRPPSKARFQYETITDWVLEKEIQPGVVALTDYDFINPKKALEAKAAISRKHAVPDLEVFDYPGQYDQAADGENYARIRIEELQAQYEVATAQTDARGITPGYRLKMTEHPRADQNREYLIVSATYDIVSDEFESGDRGGGNGARGRVVIGAHRGAPAEPAAEEEPQYRCTFTAIDADSPFRPARITPRPVIQGPQTAIVVGKEGEEIWTDEHGRVKVMFHWDRYSSSFEQCSCWIRVAQVWAGKKWGGIFTPRVGQEVIVEFLEGDPDRPIITGRVYNGDNKTPYPLPGAATMSTIKSNSSKGGGGFNEIRLEDKKGDEHIFIHAEKDLHFRTKNDRIEIVLNNSHLIVKKDRIEKIEQDAHTTIVRDRVEDVGRNEHLTIAGDQAVRIDGSRSVKVVGDAADAIGGNHHEQTDGDYYLKAKNVVIEADENITINVGNSYIALASDGIKVSTAGDIVLEAKGKLTATSVGDTKIEATGNLNAKGAGGAVFESPVQAKLHSANTTVSGSGMVTVSGGLVKIN